MATTTPGSSYIINALDYYPYGKVLREYDNGAGDKYLTTQHERDQETGLDYRGARYYDSDIARFLSLDPLAVKYPSLSAYCYVGGMPIIATDPNGKDIIITNYYVDNDGNEQSFSVRYRNGKVYNLSNNKEYTPLKGGYIEAIVSQLNQLKEDGERPKAVVETLENTSNIHVITNGPKAIRTEGNANGEGPEGVKSITYFDPFNEYTNSIKDDAHKRNPRVGLIHELTHGFDREIGHDWKMNYDVYHTYGGKPKLSLGEIHAVVIENIVRARTGDKQRTQYGGVDIPEGYLIINQ